MDEVKKKRGRPPGSKTKVKIRMNVTPERKEHMAKIGASTQFKPGVSPNPGGKPVGARNRLQGDFLKALSEDFAAHGLGAIIETRETKPAEYLKIVASLMPKELEIKRPMEDMTDDEIIAGIAALQRLVAASPDAAGAAGEAGPEQAQGVSSLH